MFWAPLLVRAILDEDATAPDNGATGARLPFMGGWIGMSSWGFMVLGIREQGFLGFFKP